MLRWRMFRHGAHQVKRPSFVGSRARPRSTKPLAKIPSRRARSSGSWPMIGRRSRWIQATTWSSRARMPCTFQVAIFTEAAYLLPAQEDNMPKLPRPEGHHTITPGFAVPNAGKVVEFLERAFGAKVVERYEGPGGTIAHAEVRIGDSVVMLGDAFPGHNDPMPASLSYYVDDGPAGSF